METNHEMLRHLETCTDCAKELEMRTRLRARLKSAVQTQPVPPELPTRVRDWIRQPESRSWLSRNWSYAMAAAVLVIGAAIWVGPSGTPLPDLTDRAAQATYIRKISAPMVPVFQPGLCDHIHCALFRKYPQGPPSLQEMESRLGTEYKGLLPLLGPRSPMATN